MIKEKIDWKTLFPIYNNESLDSYRKRLKKLQSKHNYNKMSEDEKIEKRTKLMNWRESNKDRTKLAGVEWYNRNKAVVLYNAAKQRANRKGIEFSISLDRIKTALEIGICEVTGISFCNSEDRKSAFSPSIDRTDNSKGYTEENVKIVCWGYNAAKNQFPIEDVIKISNAVSENYGKDVNSILKSKIKDGIDALLSVAHNNAKAAGWWNDLETGKPLIKNKGELLMLCVSELAEAFEGERKDLNDLHLPDMKAAEVEIGDVFIRLGDYCGAYGYNISEAILRKMEYNKQRPDHKRENRLLPGGKKC